MLGTSTPWAEFCCLSTNGDHSTLSKPVDRPSTGRQSSTRSLAEGLGEIFEVTLKDRLGEGLGTGLVEGLGEEQACVLQGCVFT